MSQRDKDKSVMAEWEATEQEYARRAFELAYFIHPNVGIALRITEAAMSKLPHTFGKQGRRYRYMPAGMAQSEERQSYALRTKVGLRKEHLLQLLVLAESDSWERSTEHGNSPYPLTNEDMVIRFLKYLVQITLKRNSFYVALGVGRLIYNYQTSQVSQIYDILMQDHARFRENAYLRKQKKLLMEEMVGRFGQLIRMVKIEHGEYRFVTQPTTQPLINLVKECLQRYTPWDTTCVVQANFDPAESIDAFSFRGTNPDKESSIEMNRIHTILDPDCFSKLVASLGLELPENRLAVPRFFFSDDDQPRGDRFNPPSLKPEDQRQLQRASEDKTRRRRSHFVGVLRIYVDDVEAFTFDSRRMRKVAFKCRPAANVMEVRGLDSEGELPLATLLLSSESLADGASLEDSVVLEGGQKFSILLTAVKGINGDADELNVELNYAETTPIRKLFALAQRAWLGLVEGIRENGENAGMFMPGRSTMIKVGVSGAFILIASAIIANIWRQLQHATNNIPIQRQVELTPAPIRKPSPSLSPSPSTVRPQTENPSSSLIARAAWNRDPESASQAIRMGVRRGDLPAVVVPLKQATLMVALNRVDAEDQAYDRYRVMLTAEENSIWLHTLQAPMASTGIRTHVLNLQLSPHKFPKADFYTLRIDGETRGQWKSMGRLIIKPDSR